MKTIKFTSIAIVTSLFLVTGCAGLNETLKPTTDALQNKTAGLLGFPIASVKITDMREANDATYFVANTPKGLYGCMIESGKWVGVGTLGMISIQPTCNKQ